MFVGVDVAKDKLDIAWRSQANYSHQRFDNNLAGFNAFLGWLVQQPCSVWVCLEATGHYSELLADYLTAHGIKVSIINPLQIKQFARSKLTRNKNDILDARIIAQYGEANQPRVFQPRSQSQKELKDLTKLVDTLKAQVIQLKNQLDSTQGEIAKQSIKSLIKALEEKIVELENQLAALVTSEKPLHTQFTLLLSIKGIGKWTAYKILAQTPTISIYQKAKQFAAAIGVTPKQNQSGKFQGKTTISRLGDARLRKALYMAALVAKRYNPVLKAFAERLKHKGKAPKAIICAVMRKLAHIIFGVLKHQKPFDTALA